MSTKEMFGHIDLLKILQYLIAYASGTNNFFSFSLASSMAADKAEW